MIIGATGGVGSGKSTVLNYLEEAYQAAVWRLDDVARDMQKKGGPLYQGMAELFGEECLLEDGELNRRAIAQKMYKIPGMEEKVNELVHPAVMEKMKGIIKDFREKSGNDPKKYLVIEAALLLEAGYGAICDELWYIYASESVRRERLAKSRGYDDRLIDGIMARQLDEKAFRAGCQVVINNSGSFEDTKRQIDERLAT